MLNSGSVVGGERKSESRGYCYSCGGGTCVLQLAGTSVLVSDTGSKKWILKHADFPLPLFLDLSATLNSYFSASHPLD